MSPEPSTPPPTALEYAPPPERPVLARARRYWPHVVIAVALIAAVVWGPGVIRQVFYLRAQAKCLQFEMPAEQVAYANSPEEAAGLLAKGCKPVASVTGSTPGQPPGVTMSAGATLPPLEDVGEATLASYAGSPFGYLRQTVPGAPQRTGAFLHARYTPDGRLRLVAVVFLERQLTATTPRRLEVNTLVWRPALWEPGSRLQLVGLSTLVLPNLDLKKVRVYAGRADEADPKHFTIPYDVDGVAGVIDGNLDDFDQARLQVRDGPAAGTAFDEPRR